MNEKVENLILEHLRVIRQELTEVRDTQREHGRRLVNLEQGQATIIGHLSHLAGADASLDARYDRLVDRIERIERRLEITDKTE